METRHYEVTQTTLLDDDGYPFAVLACAGFANENDLRVLLTLDSRCADCERPIGLAEGRSYYNNDVDILEWVGAWWSSQDAKLRCEDCSIADDEKDLI